MDFVPGRFCGFCPGEILSRGNFGCFSFGEILWILSQGDFVPGRFCTGKFCTGEIMSWGDFVPGRFWVRVIVKNMF